MSARWYLWRFLHPQRVELLNCVVDIPRVWRPSEFDQLVRISSRNFVSLISSTRFEQIFQMVLKMKSKAVQSDRHSVILFVVALRCSWVFRHATVTYRITTFVLPIDNTTNPIKFEYLIGDDMNTFNCWWNLSSI